MDNLEVGIVTTAEKIKDIKGLEEQIKAAMKESLGLEYLKEEEEKLRCSVGAVMFVYGAESDEFKKIDKSLKAIDDNEEPEIDFIKLWNEVKWNG